MQDDIMEKRFNTQLQKKFAMIDKTTLQLKERMESTIERKTELDMKPRAPIVPRIDPMTLPYRPKLIIPKEKIEELFSLINLMNSQELKQYSVVNNITLNVEDPISGDNLIHKVITSPNPLKKEFHRLNIVKFLVQNNVHPDKPNKENQTPIHLACKAQYSTIVNYLISLDVDLNFQDNYGFSSLHYALQGKIELYEEPRQIKNFIQKPKKVDFTKREDLVAIKEELWDIIKDDPFLGLLKHTLDLSLFNDSKIDKLILDYKKKLVDLAIDEKVTDRNKIIKEEFEIIKKSITELITKKWGGFKDLSELNLHKVEAGDNSWVSNPIEEFSPLTVKDVKEEIRNQIENTKNEIRNICNTFQFETYNPAPGHKSEEHVYLINILFNFLNDTAYDKSLIKLIEDNKNLSKYFRDIYPFIAVTSEILKEFGEKKIIEQVDEIIDLLNKYNGYIFLYYYVFHQNNLIKLPKFNYYLLPPLDKERRVLFFDDNKIKLNYPDGKLRKPEIVDGTPVSISNPEAIPNDADMINIINTIQNSTSYPLGVTKHRNLMQEIFDRIEEGSYIIKKESLILAKDSKLPPSLMKMLSELYKYNLMKIILLVFNDIKNKNKLPNKIDDLFKINNPDDSQKYLVIGKLTQEIVNDLAKKYIEFQTKMFMEKIIKDDNSYLTQFTDIIQKLFIGLYNNPKDYGINLKETGINIEELKFVNTEILKKNRICAAPGIEDIYEFMIYPEEYAISDLLKSKYVVKTHKNIYIKLLENNARFLLDSNNQTPIFPILKFHQHKILAKLLEFTDSNSYDFLKDEFNNHLFKLTNGNKDTSDEWLCNFVLYQKEEIVSLILNNDKYGNNFPNDLDKSFERVCYIMNEYVSNKDFDSSNIDMDKDLSTDVLFTYLLHKDEMKIVNEENEENEEKKEKIKKFYKDSNEKGEVYFRYGKYTYKNIVLSFVKDLLIEMTRKYIISSYSILIKNILYEFFKENLDLINDHVIDKIKDVLKNEIAIKIVENSINIFEDSNKESEFNLVSVKELLDGVLGLLTVDTNILLNEDSTAYKNIKEANSYFDTFVSKTVLNWNVICENVLKFNINQGRIIRCLFLVNKK